jgi:hypothetical protein
VKFLPTNAALPYLTLKILQLDVETAAANVLDIAALIDPSKIISKIKYHLLGHVREDIIHFGPLVGVATEVFECFNVIFQYCSILSNHLAPSRDIAHQLAEQETLKHLLSGGWWAVKDGKWGRSGTSIRNFIATDKILQALIRWGSNDTTKAAGESALILLRRGVTDADICEQVPLNFYLSNEVKTRKFNPVLLWNGAKPQAQTL